MSPDVRFGFLAGMGAYFIWGLLPIYFKLIIHIDTADILAHRIFWSLPTGFALILIARKWSAFLALLKSRDALWLVLSSLLIGLNWLTYIWAVGQDRVMEASLGYYMNPLVNVAVAALFLSERLRRLQWVAVGLAAIAVLVETFALGHLPWVSLILCVSFSGYGLIRRRIQVDSRVGFTIEVLVLLPLALLWFSAAFGDGRNVSGNGAWDVVLLSLSGPITATPLILFALAAKRLRFSTIGIMQYLGPSLQLIVALFYGEQLTPLRFVTFGLIWAAVVIFSLDAFGEDRKQKRSAMRPA